VKNKRIKAIIAKEPLSCSTASVNRNLCETIAKNEERHVQKEKEKIWTTIHKTQNIKKVIRYAQQFKRLKQKANNLKQSHKMNNIRLH